MVKTYVPSVLSNRMHIKIILEYGLILFCGDKALTDGVVSEQFGVGVCLFWQVVGVQKKQCRAKNRALRHTQFNRDKA